ncbi:MAG TPA: hypothetical protein VH561_00945 [Micromonosporaceae bacterium]|jgi:hypothetical protein
MRDHDGMGWRDSRGKIVPTGRGAGSAAPTFSTRIPCTRTSPAAGWTRTLFGIPVPPSIDDETYDALRRFGDGMARLHAAQDAVEALVASTHGHYATDGREHVIVSADALAILVEALSGDEPPRPSSATKIRPTGL